MQVKESVKRCQTPGEKKNSTDSRHKFLASNPNLLQQHCAEHHNLLVVWHHPKDFLDVSAHVWWVVGVIR
jgi:hypothetical protein